MVSSPERECLQTRITTLAESTLLGRSETCVTHDDVEERLFEPVIQIGLLSVTSRGEYFQDTPVHSVGSIVSKLKGFRPVW